MKTPKFRLMDFVVHKVQDHMSKGCDASIVMMVLEIHTCEREDGSSIHYVCCGASANQIMPHRPFDEAELIPYEDEE